MPQEKTPREIAQGMLARYSSPKAAHEMALINASEAIGSISREWWASVAREIRILANIDIHGQKRS